MAWNRYPVCQEHRIVCRRRSNPLHCNLEQYLLTTLSSFFDNLFSLNHHVMGVALPVKTRFQVGGLLFVREVIDPRKFAPVLPVFDELQLAKQFMPGNIATDSY